MSDREFEALFTPDKPVIFNFHSYPFLIHRLTYRRPSQHNIHVRGYKEQGNINTPLELAIRNQTDRFNLAIDGIDRMPRFRVTASSAREALIDRMIGCVSYAHEVASTGPRTPTGGGHSKDDYNQLMISGSKVLGLDQGPTICLASRSTSSIRW
jgi:phosphoketolase